MAAGSGSERKICHTGKLGIPRLCPFRAFVLGDVNLRHLRIWMKAVYAMLLKVSMASTGYLRHPGYSIRHPPEKLESVMSRTCAMTSRKGKVGPHL